MNCPELLLLEYAAGRLDAAARAAAEAHLQTCRACVELLSEQAALWTVLDEWEPQPVTADFNRRLWRRLDQAAAGPWYRRLMYRLRTGAWKPAVPLTAAAAMMIAGFLFDHRAPVTPGPASSVTSVEAEQAEKALDDLQLLKQLDGASRPM